MSKIKGTPKYFEVADRDSTVETSLLQFLTEFRNDLTPSQKGELHLCRLGEQVTLNDFIGHTVRLTRTK
jgi:hypothetical protein